MEPSASPLSPEQIISAASTLSLVELERVFDSLLVLQAERKAARLTANESALLGRINQGPPVELRERLRFLQTKRENETISNVEYEELTQLTDRVEELHADRMAALAELATLRGVPLPLLLEQLGLHFPEHV